MGQTFVAIAKQAAQMLMIELFVPGGTLIALSLLLVGRVPGISDKLPALSRLPVVKGRGWNDLVAYWTLRRF
jgi:hypothetical protein